MNDQLILHLYATNKGKKLFLTFSFTKGRKGEEVARRTYPVRYGRLKLWREVKRFGDWYVSASELQVRKHWPTMPRYKTVVNPLPTDRWGRVPNNLPPMRITQRVRID